MLTQTENEFLTQVGPGTPGGELLRRYWHPVAPVSELSDERPTRFTRILGEDLVLFLDKSGRVGLIADHCSHRSASLCYGRVEERGIACAYHGWLYDTEGNILETPPERNDAVIKSVHQTAYPVRRWIGLYWAYLGPQPAPEIPKYDVWARRDGRQQVIIQPLLSANWVQPMENSADPAHLQILHQDTAMRGRTPVNTTRGFTDDVETFDFYQTSYGLMKKRTYTNGYTDEHPILFPNILRQGNGTQIRVPLDDKHTYIVFVRFLPSEDGSVVQDETDIPVTYEGPIKQPADKRHPEAHYTMHNVQPQDMTMWETQGPIVDRTVEHLSWSDRGIVMYRRLLREQIEQVQMGLDPLAIVRDPGHEIIDTKLQESLDEMTARQTGGGRDAPRREPAAAGD
ncbi:MAG TPA: Rieske 2Fe-2S domain-containing protein [Dehalococcoidia bacterium]|nr:Rieske 2Fe-2S domain-containing protein [Dehalococcoidia bacterium]